MKTYRNQLIFIKDKESKSSLLKHAVFLILPCVQSNSTEWCHVWLLVEKIGILFVDNNKWPLFLSRWLGICITPTKLPSFTLKSTNLGQGHLSKIIPCQKSQNISITKVPSKDNEHHKPLGVCCCQEGGVGVDANLGKVGCWLLLFWYCGNIASMWKVEVDNCHSKFLNVKF